MFYQSCCNRFIKGVDGHQCMAAPKTRNHRQNTNAPTSAWKSATFGRNGTPIICPKCPFGCQMRWGRHFRWWAGRREFRTIWWMAAVNSSAFVFHGPSQKGIVYHNPKTHFERWSWTSGVGMMCFGVQGRKWGDGIMEMSGFGEWVVMILAVWKWL